MNQDRTRQAAGLAVWCMIALVMQTASRADGKADAAETPDALIRRAAAAEQAGLTNEAVTAYESLLRQDATFETVVGQRLVDLYIGKGQASEALARAARVARRPPAPHAFLAGVYSRLNMNKEAELLLKKAVAEERSPHTRVTLQWQLADIQARQGDTAAAMATLADARDKAPADALRQTSAQRLDALRGQAARQKPKAEDAP